MLYGMAAAGQDLNVSLKRMILLFSLLRWSQATLPSHNNSLHIVWVCSAGSLLILLMVPFPATLMHLVWFCCWGCYDHFLSRSLGYIPFSFKRGCLCLTEEGSSNFCCLEPKHTIKPIWFSMILFFELELKETREIIWPQLTIFKRKSKILPKSKVVWGKAGFANSSFKAHAVVSGYPPGDVYLRTPGYSASPWQ